MTRKFTGMHMLTVMLLFFGTVIAVNLLMARLAISTFGGTVVDNSYVASQEFNGWLAKGRQQKALGWAETIVRGPDGFLSMTVTEKSRALEGLAVTAVAKHPLGRAPDIAFGFVPAGSGRYRSDRALPAGRWQVHIGLRRGQDQVRLIEDVG